MRLSRSNNWVTFIVVCTCTLSTIAHANEQSPPDALYNKIRLDEASSILFFIGCLGVFVWTATVIYLRNKWLSFLEDELDSGVRFYSQSLLLAQQGVLHYSTVFLIPLQAKRYNMHNKLTNIPRHVQRQFISSFILFWLSLSCMILSIIIMECI